MTAEWYCQIGGKVTGPYTTDQLRRLAAAGYLQPADPVRKTEAGRWVPAGEVKGLTFLPPDDDADLPADGGYGFGDGESPTAAAPRKRLRLQADARLLDFAVGPGGVVGVSKSGRVSWWDPATGGRRAEWDGPAGTAVAVAAAAAADRAVLAVGSASGLLMFKQWTTELFTLRPDRDELIPLDTVNARVTAVATDAAGREVAAVDASGDVRFWRSGATARADELSVPGVAHALHLGQGLLAAGDEKGRVAVWNVARGKKRLELTKGSQGKPACGGPLHRPHFTANGGRLLTSSGYPVFNSQKDAAMFMAAAGGPLGLGIGHVLEKEGEQRAAEKRERVNTVRLWDLSDGELMTDWLGLLKVHPEGVAGTALSADGRRAVTVGFDDTVRGWTTHDTDYSRTVFEFARDVSKAKRVALADGPASDQGWALGWVQRAEFTPDGSAVVILIRGDNELLVVPWPRDLG